MSDTGAADVAQLQQQVEALKQQLAQAQKLTSLGELVGTTTHEFNNILMTVINYAKLGLRHQDDATREKSFQKILTAANRAAKITNGILGFARNRAGKMDMCSLAQLVDDTLLLLERELNKYSVVVERYYQPVPQVPVNVAQIQQVLVNLLINARQAMPNGGRVILKVRQEPESGMVELMVRDTGCGIPEAKLPQIFEAFYSTKSGPDASGKGGTGLGLSMCKDIVEAHRGRLRVESAVGKGTAFFIRLPVEQANKVPPPRLTISPDLSNNLTTPTS